jgi:hypothetical protein
MRQHCLFFLDKLLRPAPLPRFVGRAPRLQVLSTQMTQMTDAESRMLRDLVRTLVAENDRSEILLACMRDLLEHDNADRALDLARAMAEVIRQQQEFVRLIQKLLEGTPVERAEMQAALEKERARRNRDGARCW